VATFSTESRQLSLEPARAQLKHALINGLVAEAEEIGEQIAGLLASGEAELHRASMREIIEGIGVILTGDSRTGIACLAHVTKRKLADSTLHFAAWLWITWAATGLGETRLASEAADRLLRLVAPDDDDGMGLILRVVAEVEAQNGDVNAALRHLAEARQLSEGQRDVRGQANAMLTQARILAASDRQVESFISAQHAARLDPAWPDPLVFMTQQALSEGALDHVNKRLAALDELGPPGPETKRLARLLALVQQGIVPQPAVTDYLRLREALPDAATIGALKALVQQNPAFTYLREDLAWKLVKLGHHDLATDQFILLSGLDLDPELRSSVSLGLGYLASVRERRPLPPAPPASQKKARARSSSHIPLQVRTISGAHGVVLQQQIESITGRKAIFSGDLQIYPVPDLLEFLKNGRRTGTLVVHSAHGISAVHVKGGLIISAASPGCTNIGKLLLAKGVITQDQLDEVTAADQASMLLGGVIVGRGMAEPGTVRQARVEQAEIAVRELFTWSEGRFVFSTEAAGLDLPASIEIELDPQHLLLEAVRQLDEEGR
jgi:Domain of unknown function (DUF4388)